MGSFALFLTLDSLRIHIAHEYLSLIVTLSDY